jgi:hypothetical protein
MRESRYAFGKPIITKEGTEKVVLIEEGDRAVLRALALNPYLNRPWLALVRGSSEDWMKERLRELKRTGYIKPADAQIETREARVENINKLLCYELTGKGQKVLGITVGAKPTKILDHQAMASQCMTRLQLSCTGKLRFIDWYEILDRPETPARLRGEKYPFMFRKIAYSYRGERRTNSIRPDGKPAGFEYDAGDLLHEYFIPGIEADNSTMPIESSDDGRSSIEKKFYEYAAIAEQRLYAEHYGFPNMYVPFLFANVPRMKTAFRLLEDLDIHNRAKRIFLFAHHSPKPTAEPYAFKQLASRGPRDFAFGQ